MYPMIYFPIVVLVMIHHFHGKQKRGLLWCQLAPPWVVVMATHGVTSDDQVGSMTTLVFSELEPEKRPRFWRYFHLHSFCETNDFILIQVSLKVFQVLRMSIIVLCPISIFFYWRFLYNTNPSQRTPDVIITSLLRQTTLRRRFDAVMTLILSQVSPELFRQYTTWHISLIRGYLRDSSLWVVNRGAVCQWTVSLSL